MKLRIDHFIVALIVTTVLIMFMYFMDYIFTNRYNKKAESYNSEFEKIELELRNDNYQNVIILSQQVLAKCETGMNEIKAQSYIGISKIRLGQVENSTEIIRTLIEKYPGIKMAYSELFEPDNAETALIIFNSLLNDYVTGYDEAMNRPMKLYDIFDTMDKADWARFFFIFIGSMMVYEIIIMKRKKKNEPIA